MGAAPWNSGLRTSGRQYCRLGIHPTYERRLAASRRSVGVTAQYFNQ